MPGSALIWNRGYGNSASKVKKERNNLKLMKWNLKENALRGMVTVLKWLSLVNMKGFPGDTVVKYLPANSGDTRDLGSIPGSGRSSREGNGNRLQYSCLENSRDRGAWQGTVHGIERVTAPLSDWAYTHSKQKIEHSLPNQAFHKDKLSFQTVSTFKSKKRTGFHFKHLYFHVVSPNQKRRNVFWPLRFSYSPKGKCINVLLCLFYVGKFLAFIICKNHD